MSKGSLIAFETLVETVATVHDNGLEMSDRLISRKVDTN